MTRRLQDLGLVVLAVVAAALIFVTFRQADTLPAPTGALAPSLSNDASAAPGDTAAVTTEASPVDDAAQTADGDPALADARAVLASTDPVVISVLGDSTSNARQEWVHRWALDLATQRPVTISHWDETSQAGFVTPDVLSDTGSAGGPVTIWSGSQSGASAAYSLDFLTTIIPEQPDLVILNYGHNQTPDTVAPDLTALLDTIRASYGPVPIAVVLQQPQLGDANAGVRGLVADWAAEQGLPTIDVAQAFLDTADYTALLSDELHPNDDGSVLWAQTVEDALDP